jgi:peptidoglycan hydrolase CwlO-like protein
MPASDAGGKNVKGQTAMKLSRHGALLTIIMGLVITPIGLAAPKGDADIVKTLNKAQGMIRQLSQEKAELEAKLAPLQKELDDTKRALEDKSKQMEAKTKELQAKDRELQALQVDVKRKGDVIAVHEKNADVFKKNNEILKKNNEILKENTEEIKAQAHKLKEELVGQLETAKSQTQEVREQAQQLEQELNANQQDNQLLVGAVKERSEWIDKCTRKNGDLVKANKQMLDNIGNQSFWDTLKEAEPFTGIGRVEKENKMESYRYKLNDLRVTPWDGGTTGNIR